MSLVTQTIPSTTCDELLKLHVDCERDLETPSDFFEKIKKTAENTELWRKMLNGHCANSSCSQDLLFSCIANFDLLNLCFLGEERAAEVYKRLHEHYVTRIPLKMYDDEDELVENTVIFHNILTREEQLELEKDVKNYSFSYLGENIENSIRDVPHFIIPKIQKLYLQNVIQRPPIQYSHPLIDALESQINQNSIKVNENCSFLYHVVINTPKTTAATCAQKEVAKSGIVTWHAFILEQYYSPQKNEALIYVHHSVVDEFSLAENYARIGGNKEAASLDSTGQKDFFHNFRGVMLSGREMLPFGQSLKFNTMNICIKSCFGFDVGNQYSVPLIYFRWEDKIFSGIAFRYVTSMVDPKECHRHIDEAIKKYG